MIYDDSTLDGIYVEGLQAWWKVATLDENPYDKQTEAWHAWRAGWYDQDAAGERHTETHLRETDKS